MNDLVTTYEYLPATIDELQQWIIINKERLNAHRAKIRAIEKTSTALAAKEAAIQDGQYLAEIILDAEVRLGELLEAIKPKPIIESSADGTINKAPLRGRKRSLPSGMDKKQSHYAQTLAKHKDVVEQTKADAKEEGRIATSAEVIGQIQRKHTKKEDPNKIIRQEYDDGFELYIRAVRNARDIKYRSVSKEEIVRDLETLKQMIGG